MRTTQGNGPKTSLGGRHFLTRNKVLLFNTFNKKGLQASFINIEQFRVPSGV